MPSAAQARSPADVLPTGWRRRGEFVSSVAASRLDNEPEVVRLLLETFVREVPSREHRLALHTCVSAWATTEALLGAVLERPDTHDLFEWLGHLVRFHMVFTKRLREGIRRGRIRSSIRIWTRPHVKVGGRYRMDDGHIVVDSIAPIDITDITYDLAGESGFESVDDLLRIARHGQGNQAYLIRFHYLPPGGWDTPRRRSGV